MAAKTDISLNFIKFLPFHCVAPHPASAKRNVDIFLRSEPKVSVNTRLQHAQNCRCDFPMLLGNRRRQRMWPKRSMIRLLSNSSQLDAEVVLCGKVTPLHIPTGTVYAVGRIKGQF